MNENIINKWQILIKACKDYYVDDVPTGLSDEEFDRLEKEAWEQDNFNARLYVFENYTKGTKVQNNYIEKISKTKVTGTTMLDAIVEFQKRVGKKVYADLKYDGSSIAIYVDPNNGKPLREVTVGNIHTVDKNGGEAEPGVDQTWKLAGFLPAQFPKGIVAIQAEALIDYTKLDNPETARQRANGLINSKYCDTSLLTLRAYRYYTDDSPAGIALRNMDYREVLSSFEIVRDETGYIKFAPADTFTVEELGSVPGYTESDHTQTSTGFFLNDGWVLYDEKGICLGALKFAGAGSSSEGVIKTTTREILWNNQVSKGKDSWSANIRIDPVTVKGITVRKPSAGSVGKMVENNITPGAEVSIILANSTIPMIGETFKPGNGNFSWPICSCGWQLSEKDVYGSLLKCGNPLCTERIGRMKKYLSENTNIDLNKFLVIDRFKWENTDVDLDKIKQLVREGKKEEYHDYLLSFMSSKLQKRNMELVWQASWEALYEKEQGKY